MRYLIAETTWKLVSLSKAVADSGTLRTRCDAGEEIEDFHQMGEHDLIVLDAAQLRRHCSLTRLRELRPDTPICLIARKPEPEQIATWLMSGADTVIDEAAPLPEMLGRLAAVARRAHGIAQPTLERGPLYLDLAARRVHVGEVTLSLSPKLYEILEFLALRPGRLASREALLNHVYGFENEPAPRVFDVYMCNLRTHLNGIAGALRIDTVRGSGYRLEVTERRKTARALAA
ncbi:response regulator transcription factor [Salipiger sp. P9]|uniref:winged helix-turn-helix domain-containing protein n=1 Tax=Salipiger pentaromativorans TaxID=2943193 RepID=UPI002157EADD|nr:response regulator transcription factor [Salipiger pentaromativorans]MCR8550735.1 response regulator transcription factor [Salipiger pentaromativorans]